MTVLVPMRPASYPAWLEAAIADYAEDNVASGRWPAAGAVARSRADFASLLPRGLATPDNHLFEILVRDGGPVAGFLWLAIERRDEGISGFVYDIKISPGYRRQGHASRALTALEAVASAQGATSLGLHVFAFNAGARALYERLGYRVASLNLRKPLGIEPA